IVQEVAPADLVVEATNTARGLVEARGLALQFAIAEGLPPILVDPLRIRQVLINLLNNAARFTERGSVTVSARREGDAVVFTVTDTGVGIAPEDIPVIFEEFKQLDSATTRRHEGAGLGLAISRRFVELHGGRIWVESDLGHGSAFSFSLPAKHAEATEEPLAPGRSPVRWGLLEANAPALLAVTASTTAAALISRYVRGCRTVIVQDLEQAGEAARELMPQVVLLDQACSGELDLAQLALAWDLPEALFLRCPLPGQDKAQPSSDISGYLIKPISQQNLWDTLRRFGDQVDKVLVVDDDRDFVRLMARLLDSPVRRYQVIRAHSGQEALRMLERHTPDLALVDVRMPDMDGWQLTAAIRSNPLCGRMPIVIISGQDEVDSLEPLRGTVAIARGEGFAPAETIHWIQDSLDVATRAVRLIRPNGAAPADEPTPKRSTGAVP
ncbi:MAG: ATP-binding protein, partial [Chloroflexota bacterium]